MYTSVPKLSNAICILIWHVNIASSELNQSLANEKLTQQAKTVKRRKNVNDCKGRPLNRRRIWP